MRVALYQNNPVFGEIERNLDEAVNAVAGREFDLLVLPELFATGYQFKTVGEAVTMGDQAGAGLTFERLRILSREKDAVVVYGFPERHGMKCFNSALAILPDASYFLYQKTHLFDTEKGIFSPGETGFFTFTFRGIRLGMMICFDWRFPESARKLALAGAQIICHPSNLILPHCPDAMITRALENNVFTVTADRVGKESRSGHELQFIGSSRIISPGGMILAQLGQDDVGYLSAEINPADAENKKITPRNDIFQDRRPEYY
ncbi:MAG: beta-ureidopropionase [Candidatus Zixiibacteriota bacterium]|nr:MAG: beta-ureidopropionase [candidate division Zixibacteria bacterium]